MSHVELSPSSASRWLACPGSVALSRGFPDTTSAAAEEGTKAHALAEALLNDPYANLVGYDADMVEYVREFVQFCFHLAQNDGVPKSWATEQKLTLAGLGRPDMGGTADFICWSPSRLDIVDLKYGKGVFVDANDNPQLLYYALMGMLWCEEKGFAVPPEVRITIVQPRIEYVGDTIRSVSYTLDDMLGFAEKLLSGAYRVSRASSWGDMTDAGDKTLWSETYLNVGSHCRWCKAITICPKQKQEAAAVAQMEFDVITPAALPAPTLMGSEELGRILERARYLKQWVDALEKEATERLGRNELVPGWKLVPKRGNRKWAASYPELMEVASKIGLLPDDVTEIKFKGIGEVEKAFKKKGATLPEHLTNKESSGFTLVPSADSRPDRAEIASSEFTVLSSSTE
jgi:Protein of unknown function (DUF2800)